MIKDYSRESKTKNICFIFLFFHLAIFGFQRTINSEWALSFSFFIFVYFYIHEKRQLFFLLSNYITCLNTLQKKMWITCGRLKVSGVSISIRDGQFRTTKRIQTATRWNLFKKKFVVIFNRYEHLEKNFFLRFPKVG